MSATNRGAKRKKQDFYATPFSTIYSLIKSHKIKGNYILEPCAGSGNISLFIKKFHPEYQIDQIEIRSEEEENLKSYGNVEITDFLKYHTNKRYDTIITNPPYSIAREIIERCFLIAKKDTEIIMLLRLGFFESISRHYFWKLNPISKLYVLSNRPKFLEKEGNKGTDFSAYGWFVWNNDQYQTIDVI